MPAAAAAHYLGMSESKVRRLNIRRRICNGNRLYDIHDLDEYAETLEIEGIGICQKNEQADRAFGIPSKRNLRG
jgi:hypothetical protein